jgi:hypothetical protein
MPLFAMLLFIAELDVATPHVCPIDRVFCKKQVGW